MRIALTKSNAEMLGKLATARGLSPSKVVNDLFKQILETNSKELFETPSTRGANATKSTTTTG